MVRDEADIIAACIRHHFVNEGFDRIIVVDDSSSDGTFEIFQSLADERLSVERRHGVFRQANVVSDLARRAFTMGATWIVPFDADEFWHAPGGLSRYLQDHGEADAFQVEVVNYVQHRSVCAPSAQRLLDAKYRTKPFGDATDAQGLVERGACSYVESAYPAKFIHRATATVEIQAGNHRTVHATCVDATDVKCLHLPLRARTILDAKVAQSLRLDEANYPPSHGWHLRRFAALAKSRGLDDEWRANSEDHGHLDTKRGRIALVYDPRLSRLIANLASTTGSTVRLPSHARLRAVLSRIGLWRARGPKPDPAPGLHRN